VKCDFAEAVARTAFDTDRRQTSLTNLLQAGGQLEAHYRKMCPCYGFPPVERNPVPEPIHDQTRAPRPKKKKKDFKHGANGYSSHHCRCPICREGRRLERQKYRPLSDSVKIRLDPVPLINRLTRDERLEAVENSTISRWRKDGIGVYSADKWCIRLGYHPVEIWGQDFYLGATEEVSNG
jgi:hypothetical protein